MSTYDDDLPGRFFDDEGLDGLDSEDKPIERDCSQCGAPYNLSLALAAEVLRAGDQHGPGIPPQLLPGLGPGRVDLPQPVDHTPQRLQPLPVEAMDQFLLLGLGRLQLLPRGRQVLIGFTAGGHPTGQLDPPGQATHV